MNFDSVVSFINDVFFIRFDGAQGVIRAVVEIAIFAYFIYLILKLVRDTRAWQLSKGILFILLITAFSNILQLKSLSFVLNNTFSVMAIGVLIIFQPELRRGLEQIGRSSLRDFFGAESENTETLGTINALSKACAELSKTFTGALIVVERDTKVGDIINTGLAINSNVTAELLINIFTPNTPLHDGAVIIRDNRIKAATCYLPLSENAEIDKELGTRHRAAIGVTEVSDAIAIVVSEETGAISLIQDGKIERGMSPERLRAALGEQMPEMAGQRQQKILLKFAPKLKTARWHGADAGKQGADAGKHGAGTSAASEHGAGGEGAGRGHGADANGLVASSAGADGADAGAGGKHGVGSDKHGAGGGHDAGAGGADGAGDGEHMADAGGHAAGARARGAGADRGGKG